MTITEKLYIIIIFGIILSSCAKPATPSGGPRDKTPPKLVEKKSTQNYQTNYYPKKIALYFDEWITLKNKNQILISPPLDKKPKISYRGKHINLVFDETDTLKQNTTYTINFGKSITDFTEGNPLENFVFIFSTGDEIDSLEIQGKVVNSFDNKPLKDVTVLLYDTDEDSVVVKSKPYYFANTDKDGKFKITHIKEGFYKVFALKDGNANYLYDMETEQIGYLDTMVFITNDSLKKDLLIEMFTPDSPLKILDKSVAAFGKIKIEYNRKPDSLKVLYSSVDIFDKAFSNDSLLIWYDNKEKQDSINLVLKSENRIDTMIFKIRKQYKKPVPLVLLNKTKIIKTHPDKFVSLMFNQAVLVGDSSKIILFEQEIKENKDTTKKIKFDTIITNVSLVYEMDSSDSHKFLFKGKWNEGKKYKLSILPGFLKTYYGVKNDTVEMVVSTNKKEDYGQLTCHFDSLKQDDVYIVSLKQGKEILQKDIIKNKGNFDIAYGALLPGKYTLEVIVDTNNNGKWDGGDYFKRRKAEKRYSFNLNEIKANWSQEENIKLKTKNKDETKK